MDHVRVENKGVDEAVPVNIVAGSASGTQYTEGDTDASITGTAAMMEVAANVLQPVQGTVADGLLVNLGTNNDVTVTGTVTANLSSGTNTNEVVGDVADDAPAAGNPLGIGLVARTTNRTAVADGDAVRAVGDDLGRLVTVVGQVRDLVNHQHTQIASSSSETTIITAAGAGVFADLVGLILTNQTATAVNVTIKDATAGTTRMVIALAANGGAVIMFPRPVKQASANNNWTATLSSAAVTVNIFAQFESNV